MKGPRRLIHDDPGFRRLVDAMQKDGPSDAQMTKALSAAAKLAALSPTRGAGSWLGRTSVQIGLTIVAVAGIAGVIAASFRYDESATTPGGPPTAASEPPAVARAVEPPIASVKVDELPSVPVPSVPASLVPPSSRPKGVDAVPAEAVPRPSAPPPCPPDGAPCRHAPRRATFAEELALTSEARAALERGDIRSCLGAVDRYQRRFRGGIFAQEIDVIHIEALAKSGARERAYAAAQEFLRDNASSPYEDRVRSVLEHTK